MPARNDTRTSHDKQDHRGIGDPKGPVDWEIRCRFLEQRDQERARELMKVRAKARGWQAEAERQRKRADEADANSRRFHALLIQERVLKTKRQGEAA